MRPAQYLRKLATAADQTSPGAGPSGLPSSICAIPGYPPSPRCLPPRTALPARSQRTRPARDPVRRHHPPPSPKHSTRSLTASPPTSHRGRPAADGTVAEHMRLGSTVGDVPGAILRFVEDVDIRPADGVRVAQLTPPGSACSVTTGLCQRRRCGRQGQSGISDPSLHHARRHALRKQHLLTGPGRCSAMSARRRPI
jgi:hypothetical protein